jgi:hypothetical protein
MGCRHDRADARVGVTIIALWLGHVSVDTNQIDLQLREKALA